jgi:hypothetical protein
MPYVQPGNPLSELRMNENKPSRRGIRASSESPDFLLEFDCPSNEFHRGFQCGEIWACLVDQVPEVQAIISADNTEMVMRMTTATGYGFEARYLNSEELIALDIEPGDWMVVLMRLSL